MKIRREFLVYNLFSTDLPGKLLRISAGLSLTESIIIDTLVSRYCFRSLSDIEEVCVVISGLLVKSLEPAEVSRALASIPAVGVGFALLFSVYWWRWSWCKYQERLRVSQRGASKINSHSKLTTKKDCYRDSVSKYKINRARHKGCQAWEEWYENTCANKVDASSNWWRR